MRWLRVLEKDVWVSVLQRDPSWAALANKNKDVWARVLGQDQ